MRTHRRRGSIRRRALGGGIAVSVALLAAAAVAPARAAAPSGADEAAQLAGAGETTADWEKHAVIPRPEVDALVLAGRAFLWGLRISRLTEQVKVKGWVEGFGSPGTHPLPLRKVEETPDTHTYRVPGGKSWRPTGNPDIILSINPPPGATVDGFPLLGRLYLGELRLNGKGDTVLRALRGNFCIEDPSRGNRPPPAVNCITAEPFGPF